MSDAGSVQTSSPEWTIVLGWKAALMEGGKWVTVCGVMTSIATFMSGILPLTIPFMLPTIALGTLGVTLSHAYFANKYLLRPAFRRLEPSRRLFIRWGSRIAFANLIVVVYTPSTLFSAIVSPVAFATFITIQKRVLDIQQYRQDRNLPLTLFERFAIGSLMFISMVLFGGLLILAGLLGWSLEWALDYFQLLPDINTENGLPN